MPELPQSLRAIIENFLPSPGEEDLFKESSFQYYCQFFGIDASSRHQEFWKEIHSLASKGYTKSTAEWKIKAVISDGLKLHLIGASKPSDVVTLEKLIIDITVKHSEAKIQVAQLLSDLDDQKMVETAILNRLHERGTIRMGSSVETIYMLEKVISGTDAFGKYDIDMFRGLIDISITVPEGKAFPLYWRISLDKTKVEMNPCFTILVHDTPTSTDFITSSVSQSKTIGTDRRIHFKSSPIVETNMNSLSLVNWIRIVLEKSGRDPSVMAAAYEKLLKEHWVFTVDDLKEWSERDWSNSSWLPPNAKIVLQEGVNELKTNHHKQYNIKEKKRSQEKQQYAEKAFIAGSLHMIKRYFYYHSKRIDQVPLLSEEAVHFAFEALDYNGPELLDRIKNQFFKAFQYSNTQGVSVPRGLLLYGPPGTGKTTITEHIGDLIGLYQVVPPISSTEVNRSLVGETEKLLLDICNRATLIPHLAACIAIDEIDNLAPKRNDDSNSQGKKDALSILLAVIGGIKDVENLVFLASTNYRNNIDDAFLRRMRGQFFVGRPSPVSRKEFLKKSLPSFSDSLLNYMTALTCNFTGAALKELISDIIVKISDEKPTQADTIQKVCVNCAIAICDQFQTLLLGKYNIPELFLKNPNADFNLLIVDGPDLNGKMLVDLSGTSILLRHKFNANNAAIVFMEKNTREACGLIWNLSTSTNKTAQILPYFAQFSVQNNVDFIQLLNMDVLLRSNAFDEKTTKEVLNEKMEEVYQYNKTITIFDLDSLVGISLNQSDSSMGVSNSVHANHSNILTTILHYFMDAHVDTQLNKMRWMVVISSHAFLISMFRELSKFPRLQTEIQLEIQEQQQLTQPRKCKTCGQSYITDQSRYNNMDCRFHPGFLYDSKNPNKAIYSHEVASFLIGNSNASLKYICCDQMHGSQGCQNSYHNHEIDLSGEMLRELEPKYWQKLGVLQKQYQSSN